MTAPSSEGVIKFQLEFKEGPAPDQIDVVELNAWRKTFLAHGLIGQDPSRYDGQGFGILSRRLPQKNSNSFIISGTQTGYLCELIAKDYSTVTRSDPAGKNLSAIGQTRPSSETLSHSILYQSSPEILWVVHLHSPDIFKHYRNLQLPYTDPAAE